MRDAHGVGLYEALGRAGSAFTGVAAELGEDDWDVLFSWVFGREHFADRRNDVHVDGFGVDMIDRDAEHFVGVEDDVVEVIFCAGLDGLFEPVDVDGFGA